MVEFTILTPSRKIKTFKEYCQTPDLGLGLGVDFNFAPLHISPATFEHLPGNPCTSLRQPKTIPKLLSNSKLRPRTRS